MRTDQTQAPAGGAPSPQTLGPILLTITEAAAMLRVGRSTAYELIARNESEVVHIGRSARVPLAAVVDLVDRLRGLAPDRRSSTP